MGLNSFAYIVKTDPINGESNIPTSQIIKVYFGSDMDVSSLQANVFITDNGGNSIPIGLFYEDRVLSVSPTAGSWLSNTDYYVAIVGDDILEPGSSYRGVRSVLGYPMAGTFNFTFRTVASATLSAPKASGISPAYQSVVTESPVLLSWPAVEGTQKYEVKLSQFSTMDPLLWSGIVADIVVRPEVNLDEGTYYWRVRAINSAGTPGDWSEAFIFGISLYPENPVVPEDSEVILPEEIITYPEDGWANVSTNLRCITAVVPATIDPQGVIDSCVTITRQSALDSMGESEVIQAGYIVEAQSQPDGSTLLIITLDGEI